MIKWFLELFALRSNCDAGLLSRVCRLMVIVGMRIANGTVGVPRGPNLADASQPIAPPTFCRNFRFCFAAMLNLCAHERGRHHVHSHRLHCCSCYCLLDRSAI